MEFRDGWFLQISGCIEKFSHRFDKKISRRFNGKETQINNYFLSIDYWKVLERYSLPSAAANGTGLPAADRLLKGG
jgi:hypothetical protein